MLIRVCTMNMSEDEHKTKYPQNSYVPEDNYGTKIITERKIESIFTMLYVS